MKKINRVLDYYQVIPDEIVPITNRLYRIKSYNNLYALKRSKLNVKKIDNWKWVYQIANDKNITSILPIFVTRTGHIFQEYDNEIYYLTPWRTMKQDDEPEHEIQSFYQALGTLHFQTKKEVRSQTYQLSQLIQREKEKINYDKNRLLTYVEKFEKRRYMSPFELRVCMQFRDLEQVFQQLDNWYDYYAEDLDENHTTYFGLCHGNLRPSHHIYQTNNSFFINWESSYFGNPIHDLYNYFYHEFKYHDCALDQLVQSFSVYEKYNPLLQSERSLLAIYLLTPKNYLQVIDDYNDGRRRKGQPFQIRALERAYFRLIHGLSMQNHLYRIREQHQEQEEEQN